MRIYFIVVVAVALLVVSPSGSDGARRESLEVSLSIELLTFAEGIAVPPDTVSVRVMTHPPPVAVFKDGQYYMFNTVVDPDLPLTGITVEVVPTLQDVWSRRTIPLRLRAAETRRVARHVLVYVVKPGTDTSYRSLDRVVAALERGDVEGPLAYFEFAHSTLERPADVRQYAVKVVFNYARSLKNACFIRGYDTCDQALGLYVKLSEWFARNARAFAEERIGSSLIASEISNLKEFLKNELARSILQQFEGVEEAFGRGGRSFGVAARQLDSILKTYSEHAHIWSQNGKPKASLLKDAGLAWFNYGLVLAAGTDQRGEWSDALAKGHEYLAEAYRLGQRTDDVKFGLSIAESRLLGAGISVAPRRER